MNTASAAASVANVANKASTFANQTVETARFEAIKEPIGFIKILQFFLAILCFAIAVNGSSSVSIALACRNNESSSNDAQIIEYDYSYPYDLANTQFKITQSCKNQQATVNKMDRTTLASDSGNIVSSAQFFVFTGVITFLYSLVFLIIYVFFKHKYDNIIYIPLIDFASTCLLALFWFAGSIAWAKAISDIQNYSNPDSLINTLPQACTQPNPSPKFCQSRIYPSYGSIVISCILGFANLVLWVGNVWFVLKETSWYKTRKQLQQQQQNFTNNPISASNINIQESAYNQNRI